MNNPVIEGLRHLLADTYLLYLKTQNYHWHVVGPNFHSLHKMFEEEYIELSAAVDEIAERIRALNQKAPATFADFLKLSCLKENHDDLKADDMIKDLLQDHEIMIQKLKQLVKTAQDAGDEETADLGITRAEVHEKTAWMLRSSRA
jgi:starvation-inducible DNA-binding protein